MLAVEPLRGSNGDDRDGVTMGSFSIAEDNFAADEALLDDINFGDLFMGIEVDGDVLPDLELDPDEIFAEFSVGSGGEEDASSGTTPPPPPASTAAESAHGAVEEAAQDAVDADAIGYGGVEPSQASDRGRNTPPVAAAASASASAKGSSQGKRKAKVDWTPELHRRFVQAVEQLGIDKAVPSRILELMGIDCLTRHNIASHLQKYRSHRKHLLAREAEAASWSQRRQIYAAAAGGGAAAAAAAVGAKREIISPWLAPTIGFPPPPPPPPAPAATVPPAHHQALRPPQPLHVWGHPTGEAAPPMVHMWLRQIAPRSPVPPPAAAAAWAAHLPPAADPSPYWHRHYPRGIPHAVTPGTPCFPQPLAPARFPPAAQVQGIVPHHHPIYRAVPTPPPPPPPPMSKHSSSQLDAHPSIESIDAAIGDVFNKPWLPLPLGLKPPAVDSVLVELQKQGVSKVPPAAACG